MEGHIFGILRYYRLGGVGDRDAKESRKSVTVNLLK